MHFSLPHAIEILSRAFQFKRHTSDFWTGDFAATPGDMGCSRSRPHLQIVRVMAKQYLDEVGP
jgi:hypothetical protein